MKLWQRRDPEQRYRMSRIENTQHRHGIAQLRRLEQIDTFDVYRNATLMKFGNNQLAMIMAAIQHSRSGSSGIKWRPRCIA